MKERRGGKGSWATEAGKRAIKAGKGRNGSKKLPGKTEKLRGGGQSHSSPGRPCCREAAPGRVVRPRGRQGVWGGQAEVPYSLDLSDPCAELIRCTSFFLVCLEAMVEADPGPGTRDPSGD